jgi:nanoRNase/pAp phosphatase (c-di-AMP/oligoRNAs hydrolase)
VQQHVRVTPDCDACPADSPEKSLGQRKVARRPIADIEIDHHPLWQRLQ